LTSPEHSFDPSEPGIDPAELEVFRRVLAQLDDLPVEHPDALAVRQATAHVFKAVKKRRRADKRDQISAADGAVVAATATGSPGRIDDETQGIPLISARGRATSARRSTSRSTRSTTSSARPVQPRATPAATRAPT